MDDGMDVESLRFLIVQHHPFLVVELDHQHRALDTVIESAVLAQTAGPAEMSLGEMPLHVAHSRLQRPGRQRRQIAPGEIEQRLTLLRAKVSSANSFIRNDGIVLMPS